MVDFIKYCNQLSPLDTEAQHDLLQRVKTRTYARGEHLLHEGAVCGYIYFINKGLAKIWSVRSDKEFIHCFFAEGVLFSVFDSYLNQTSSRFMITALEDIHATLISFDAMEALSKKHHRLETLFRKVADGATISMISRISEILEDSAPARYEKFLKENHLIADRISLGDIARYLGITQPSLSRIRNLK